MNCENVLCKDITSLIIQKGKIHFPYPFEVKQKWIFYLAFWPFKNVLCVIYYYVLHSFILKCIIVASITLPWLVYHRKCNYCAKSRKYSCKKDFCTAWKLHCLWQNHTSKKKKKERKFDTKVILILKAKWGQNHFEVHWPLILGKNSGLEIMNQSNLVPTKILEPFLYYLLIAVFLKND